MCSEHDEHTIELWQTNAQGTQLIYCKNCKALFCDRDFVDKYGNPLC